MTRRRSANIPPNPGHCEKCGSESAKRDMDFFQKKWLCSSCLIGDEEPTTVEDHVYTGTSNLGSEVR